MARELSVKEVAQFRPGARLRVDWGKYDTGEPWVLRQGVDFLFAKDKAQKSAWSWGYRHGRKVQALIVDADRIWLYIHPVEESS